MFGRRKGVQPVPSAWTAGAPQPVQAQGFLQGGTNIPQPPPTVMRTSFMEGLRKVIGSNVRTKPTYADCWLIGSVGQLDIISEYDSPSGHVVIGRASDGELEYNLTPTEYTSSDSLNGVIEEAIEQVRADFRTNGGRTDRLYVNGLARDVLDGFSDHILMACGGNGAAMEDTVAKICDIVYRYSVGLGVFDILFSDPRLEDVYVDSPCDRTRIHVTLSGIGGTNAHHRCRTNLIVEKSEVQNLVCHLKRESGLPFCQSNPVLETDLREYDARATVVGYPLSPNGDSVAIRKHSAVPWTLTRLIANGTIDPYSAGILSYLVNNRATFLICGARGAGKSSLLSALLFEFPVSQRILTIEDTVELPGEKMRAMGYKVQSMLIDNRMEGDSVSRSQDVLKTALRLGEGALAIGELRGKDVSTLYESMRVGRAGSSILGTIHGDSAKTVFDRVVHDMGISPDTFLATEVLVTVGTVNDRKTGSQIRKMTEFVATTDTAGVFTDMTSGLDFSLPVLRRTLQTNGITEAEAAEEIKARGEMRKLLAEKGRTDPKYLGPEWINAANDYVSRNTGKDCGSLLSGFGKKIDMTE